MAWLKRGRIVAMARLNHFILAMLYPEDNKERRGVQYWREDGQEAAVQWLDSWTAWVDALCAGQ